MGADTKAMTVYLMTFAVNTVFVTASLAASLTFSCARLQRGANGYAPQAPRWMTYRNQCVVMRNAACAAFLLSE